MKHILIGKHMKKIFFQVVVITIFILAIYSAIVRWILGITLVLVIGLLIWIFRCNWNDDYRMIEKFGKDYKAAISNGKLGLRTLYPCRPDSYYTSKSAIEKMANIHLPNFTIKECKESSEDFTGDYSGEATIEFQKVIDDDFLFQVHNEMKKEHSQWQKMKNGNYICLLSQPYIAEPHNDVFWSLSVKEGSAIGKIKYGRV